MAQPASMPHASSLPNEGDNIPLLKRKRLSDNNVPPATSSGLGSPDSPGKASSITDNNDSEDIPLRERSPSSYAKVRSSSASSVGRMSVNDMLAEDGAINNEKREAGMRPTPPSSNSRNASPIDNSSSMEQDGSHDSTNSSTSNNMAPYVKRTRLPHGYSAASAVNASYPHTTAGTIATAAPSHSTHPAHVSSTAMPASHSRGHPHHHSNPGYANHPPPPMHPHHLHNHSHPHPVPHMHPHAAPHPHSQGPPPSQPPSQHGQMMMQQHPPHTPNSMPNVSGGTIVMAASGLVHGPTTYPLHSPQQASFRHPPPSSGLSGRNRLNLTVHAPAYAEGQNILGSPRLPGTGGELMNTPVTVASAGPVTTSYANTTLRSSVVAMRTAAGPLPPKAKLTPRTPVGPEASRYRRPLMSATAPPNEAPIVTNTVVVSSPRTDTHPRRAPPYSQPTLNAEPVAPVQATYDSAMLDRRTDSEDGRRRFMAMMETMYERAFESSSQSAEPSPRQQRLEALAEQLDQAGGLEALIKERVSETLASILGGSSRSNIQKGDSPATILATLVNRIEQLEKHMEVEAPAKSVVKAEEVDNREELASITTSNNDATPMEQDKPQNDSSVDTEEQTPNLVERVTKIEEQLANSSSSTISAMATDA